MPTIAHDGQYQPPRTNVRWQGHYRRGICVEISVKDDVERPLPRFARREDRDVSCRYTVVRLPFGIRRIKYQCIDIVRAC